MVRSLPEGSAEVVSALAGQGQLLFDQIDQNVSLPTQTIRYALRRLREENIITSQSHLLDMRIVYYQINPKIEIASVIKKFPELKPILV